jgi:hypothetical protein
MSFWNASNRLTREFFDPSDLMAQEFCSAD